ncbi:MAG: extracellular solute-binding protein [Candidatus Omnitrophica bacterium]|nr:extracellular solute-binding protein [Candidatus Omnitrophota bacterium]MBU1997079.1 extracellular solute-binding protein [Candidatus Omnitrophota bacterium]MBU4334071.1 extracellular solute-binding protein [Candidatus Omnitrophota bacterium]
MKRLVVILLCLLISLGCAKKQKDTNTITLWHWMTDREEVLQELAKQYEAQTGIKIKIELYAPSETYTRKIIASAQTKVLPDVFGILDKKEIFAAFIKNGFVADLTNEFSKNNSEWEKSLFPKALDINRFEEDNVYGVNPGIYGVPLDVTNIQMLYNKKLLKKAGFENPPKTFDEFLVMIGALNRIGITGFVSGWGELWLADCFASNYAFNIIGEEKIMATYRGEVPYTDPDWIKVFEVFETLKNKGALIDGIVTKVNKFAEQDFALERAAFAFNGSWCVNVYQKMNPDLDYAPMIPPSISSNYPMKIWGAAGSSFVVNNSTVNKDKAIAFLKWLTDEKQQTFLSKETKNLPANRKALSSIPKVLFDFAKVADQTTHPTVWKYNEAVLVAEKFDKGIQSIIIGDKTPSQVAQEVQEVKQQVMEKENRRKKRQ